MKKIQCVGAVVALALPAMSVASEEGHFVEKMSHLQYFSHKTALAIDNKNKPLAAFYVHELEEYIEDAAKVKSYDGHPVGKLIGSMLMPSFGKFEAAVKSGDWNNASARFDELLQSCNSCHEQTGHGFINIERSHENPFMQSFAPSPETKANHQDSKERNKNSGKH